VLELGLFVILEVLDFLLTLPFPLVLLVLLEGVHWPIMLGINFLDLWFVLCRDTTIKHFLETFFDLIVVATREETFLICLDSVLHSVGWILSVV
jgi:hypothetical protein